jgi:GT2 family glycosyltransferase
MDRKSKITSIEMKLSVIIVSYNVELYLQQCLLSVFKSDFTDFEVFVVDNNSQDNSCEMIKNKFSQVKLIENKCNPGFAIANNQAIKIAQGEYVLLLNPDTVLAEDTFDNVCRFMDEHEDAGNLGVKMIDGYGDFLPESKRGFPSPFTSFCKIFGISQLFPKSHFFGQYHLLYLDENKIHSVDILAGAFMLLRSKTLAVTGLLDEAFFMYGEDIDISYRVNLAGYRNYYVPEKIIHYKGESTQKDSLKYVKIFYQSMQIFFKKHYHKSSLFFSTAINFAIIFRATLSATKRIFNYIFPIKKSKQKKTLILGNDADLKLHFKDSKEIPYEKGTEITAIQRAIKSLEINHIILSTKYLSFKKIIIIAASLSGKNCEIAIYNHEEKLLVSSKDSFIIK